MAKSSSGSDLHPLAEIDQFIHTPARLMVLAHLYVVESVDYVFLNKLTGLTWGNLSTHLTRLEEAGFDRAYTWFQGFNFMSMLAFR